MLYLISNVNIVNLATAALYDYTPYQPNAAALAAGYGTGDSCSSYGNRNFYLYFNDWFGTTIVANLPGCNLATNTTLACVWSLYNPANLETYLTSSVQTRDELFTNQGYQYSDIAFYGNAVALPGNIPVYNASVPGGGSFLTTNLSEYNSLIASGYTANGIDFYADPAGANTGLPVYRLYNPTTYQHTWTTDNALVTSLSNNGWNYEGIAFTAIDPINPTNQIPPPPPGQNYVYKFYIPQTNTYFYTSDIIERDSMINSGYDYVGIAFNSVTPGSANTVPIYRLYSSALNEHFWTASSAEETALVASGGWTNEGVVMYGSSIATPSPVYRLYNPTTGAHYWSINPYTLENMVGTNQWQSEGIAWYQP